MSPESRANRALVELDHRIRDMIDRRRLVVSVVGDDPVAICSTPAEWAELEMLCLDAFGETGGLQRLCAGYSEELVGPRS